MIFAVSKQRFYKEEKLKPVFVYVFCGLIPTTVSVVYGVAE